MLALTTTKKIMKLVLYADCIEPFQITYHTILHVFPQSNATRMLFCATILHRLSCRRFLATTALFVVSRPSVHDSEYKSLLQIRSLRRFYTSILCDIIHNRYCFQCLFSLLISHFLHLHIPALGPRLHCVGPGMRTRADPTARL